MPRGESFRAVVEETLRGWRIFFLMLAVGGIGSVTLVVVVSGATRAWLLQAGHQVPTDCIFSDAAVSFLETGDLTDDPGTQEFVRRVLEELRQSDQENNQRYVASWLHPLIQRRPPSIRDISFLIPKELTIAWENFPEEDEEIGWVAAVNLRAFGPALRTLFQNLEQGHDERETSIHVLDSGLYLGFVAHTIIVSGDARLLTLALDRCATSTARGAPPSAKLSVESWDVTGRLGGPHFQQFFGRSLSRSFMEEAEYPDCPEGLSLGIDLESSNSFVARATSDCASPHDAELLASAFHDSLAEFTHDLKAEFLFEYDVVSNDRQFAVRWRFSGLEELAASIGQDDLRGFWMSLSEKWPPGLRPFVPVRWQSMEPPP